LELFDALGDADTEKQTVEKRVWKLAQDKEGCHKVQEAFEDADSDALRLKLASEMKGHVWAACRHPYANYVLQKMIIVLPPSTLQFVVDEIAVHVCQASKNQYGCRVLQRLFEHCTSEQVEPLAKVISANFEELAPHMYGNYVVQQFFQLEERVYHQAAVELLASKIGMFGTRPNGAAVLAAAFMHCAEEHQVFLARAMLAHAGLLARMARTRKGSIAVKAVIRLLEGAERDAAFQELSSASAQLSSRRYGRSVAQALEQEKKAGQPSL
jgi:hypothetical protein